MAEGWEFNYVLSIIPHTKVLDSNGMMIHVQTEKQTKGVIYQLSWAPQWGSMYTQAEA